MTRYFHPRLLIVLLLGMASGLPLALVGGTLSIRLTESGIDRATVGLFAWASYPYVFKFLWSPLMDHLPLPFLTRRFGRRRGWLLLTQFCLFFCILLLGRADPATAPGQVALLALLVAFFSASQDIVIDAFRVEYLPQEQHVDGAAMGVFGWRVGALISSSGALILSDHAPWALVYAAMAASVLIGVVAALLAREPELPPAAALHTAECSWFTRAAITPFTQFIAAHPRWPVLLGFAALYATSDGFIAFMSNAFLLETGYSKTQIGTVVKLYGFAATILGAFSAGVLVRRTGLWKSLVVAAVFQIVTNLGYLLITHTGAELWALMLAISLDNFAGGLVTSSAVAFLMRLCHKEYTATHYALLSSLAALSRTTLAGLAGYVSLEYGWAAMFLTSAVLGIPALVLILFPLRNEQAMR
jgi:PAT family beta-lactamase induction signal transducer AmpG